MIAFIFGGLSFAFITSKEKVKVPEETTKEVIAEAFSKKYNQPSDTIKIEVKSETGSFAKGTVNFTDKSGGGIWYAAKTANGWELAFDGNGIIACDAANKYDFPNDIIPQCIDTKNGNTFITR